MVAPGWSTRRDVSSLSPRLSGNNIRHFVDTALLGLRTLSEHEPVCATVQSHKDVGSDQLHGPFGALLNAVPVQFSRLESRRPAYEDTTAKVPPVFFMVTPRI